QYLLGDPVRLNQIIVNLLSNAIKFTEKGFVELKADVVANDDTTTRIRFQVSDSGIGIPDDKLDSIFESFTKASSDTTRKFGGTGLGLTIVKKIVELQGGQIAVKSKVNEGAVFTVEIPFAIGTRKDISDQVTFRQHTSSQSRQDYPVNISVLMAEDN